MPTKNKIYYVYMYLDPRNWVPFYIGKGKGNRMYAHIRNKTQKNENKHKRNKINKILELGMEPIVLKAKEHLFENNAQELETALILHFGRIGFENNGCLTNILLNSNPPCRKGVKDSNETMLKKSISAKKREITDDWRKQNSIGHMGHTVSIECRKKISRKLTGRKLPQERIERARIARMGYSVSEKTKQKLSISNSKKTYEILLPSGDIVSIKNLGKFAKENKISSWAMYYSAKDKNFSHKGYKVLNVIN